MTRCGWNTFTQISPLRSLTLTLVEMTMVATNKGKFFHHNYSFFIIRYSFITPAAPNP